MKKLIALIALVVLTTSYSFATVVPNTATVHVGCNTMGFVCQGPADFTMSSIGQGSTGTATGATTWNVNNWGLHGTFTRTTPGGGLWAVTSKPSGALNSDIDVQPNGYSSGWETSGVTPLTGNDWKLSSTNCNSQGTFTYHFLLTVYPQAIAGDYVVTFYQDFVAD